MTQATGEGVAVRPFRVDVPEEDLVDLRQRIAMTRWPDRETVPDRSQGAQLAELQELVRYWGTDYDWRKGEAKLNTWPQFITTIDGVDVHFFHVRSRHENALPLIISHGWPGSVFEQIKVIGPLTDPMAFGARAEDTFDVVIPSLPGFGFSSRPTEVGWGLDRIGRAWDVLMKRLGYTHYVAQGGDFPARRSRGDRHRCTRARGALREGTRGVRRPERVPPERGLSLPDDDELATAGRRLRLLGLPHRPRGVHPRARRVRAVVVRQGPRPDADEGRGAGRHLPVLADEHGDLGRAAVLGEPQREPHQRGRAEDPRDHAPGGHHGVSERRSVPTPRDLGPARLPQPHLLQRGRGGRALPGLGSARRVRDGGTRGVQIPTLVANAPKKRV